MKIIYFHIFLSHAQIAPSQEEYPTGRGLSGRKAVNMSLGDVSLQLIQFKQFGGLATKWGGTDPKPMAPRDVQVKILLCP